MSLVGTRVESFVCAKPLPRIVAAHPLRPLNRDATLQICNIFEGAHQGTVLIASNSLLFVTLNGRHGYDSRLAGQLIKDCA